MLAYHYFRYLYYGLKEVIKAPVGGKVDFFNLIPDSSHTDALDLQSQSVTDVRAGNEMNSSTFSPTQLLTK